MKLLTVIGLFLDLVGVVILGVGEVRKGAASLRDLKESYPDSFHIPPNLVVTPRRLPHPLAIGQAFPHFGSSATPTI